MKRDCTCFVGRPPGIANDKALPTCLIHPFCACGCPRRQHAHEGIGECFNALVFDQQHRPKCHGCPEYRPARLKAYAELDDTVLDEMAGLPKENVTHARIAVLVAAYRELRAHHIEETTVLLERSRHFPKHDGVHANVEAYDYMIDRRHIDPDHVCLCCSGYGVRMYSNTSGWRGGMGGQAMTTDVCDQCWGSGNRERPWPDRRKQREDNEEEIAQRAVDALARSCGASLLQPDPTAYQGNRNRPGDLRHSVKQIITHLDALKRKKKVGNEPVSFWMQPLANGLRNILARAIGEPETDEDGKPRTP